MADLNDYIDYLYSKLGNMYVLGAQGEKFVSILSRVVEMEDKNYSLIDNVLTLLQTKLTKEGKDINDLEAYDCSGLFMAYAISHAIFKYDMTADGIYKAIPDKIKLSEVKKGDFLFHGTSENKTHIAYAVDKEYCIEARGTKYGVVKTKIADRDFKYAARPYWWGEDVKPVLTRELYYTNPMMKGDDVKEVQYKLNSLDYNCGMADGYFGNKTSIAVKNFQTDNNLKVDGVVGKKTAEKLGFKWEG